MPFRERFCADAVAVGFAVLACSIVGCRAPQTTASVNHIPPTPMASAVPAQVDRLPTPEPAVRKIAFSERQARNTAGDGMFDGHRELLLDPFVDQVVSSNPSVQAMTAAWRAAAQRYPQVVSLDDPMFQSMLAPDSFSSNQVTGAYALQASQKIPWAGKRETRGAVASAQAGQARQEVEDMRLQLTQTARLAFFDYYLAGQNLQLNRANRQAMQQFHDTAQAKYAANAVTQQDVLQADVELAEVERRQFELERMDRVARARINTLLLRTPEDDLPPAVRDLPLAEELPPPDLLRQTAIERRPDLAAIGAQISEAQATLALARREYYPDLEVVGRYDAFWQETPLRGQVGLNMNIPLYQQRRRAAVCEAAFRVSQRQAEYAQRVAEIQYEVQSSYEQLRESKRVVELYAEKILPAAQQNVQAATANYDVGATTFLGLIQAQRQVIELRSRQQQAIADYHRRLAELERMVGGPWPTLITAEEVRAVPVPTAE